MWWSEQKFLLQNGKHDRRRRQWQQLWVNVYLIAFHVFVVSFDRIVRWRINATNDLKRKWFRCALKQYIIDIWMTFCDLIREWNDKYVGGLFVPCEREREKVWLNLQKSRYLMLMLFLCLPHNFVFVLLLNRNKPKLLTIDIRMQWAGGQAINSLTRLPGLLTEGNANTRIYK